ncbi:hypothetical protein OS187_05620 [Xanthomonadaceae bacterium JHOS43]|nr:hypothetical protein [Xanthomonadaceae bacterium JHOS43]
MATIIARRLKDGSKSHRATIRIMRGNAVLHQETRSFRAKSLAVQWAREREGTLKRHGAGEKAVATLPLADGISIASLIDRYVKELSSIQRWGRTKEHHLRLLQRLVGEWDASTLTTDQLVEHVRQRRLSGTGPSTCNNDLIWIRTVLKTARAAWGLPVNLQAVEDASHACRTLSSPPNPAAEAGARRRLKSRNWPHGSVVATAVAKSRCTRSWRSPSHPPGAWTKSADYAGTTSTGTP